MALKMNINNSSQETNIQISSYSKDILPSYFGQSSNASQFLDTCRANNKKPFSWLT